jgi:protein TonB
MATLIHLSREERIGLLVAGVAHVALVAGLLLHRPEVDPYVPPERITVSLATDVALDSAAPNPSDNPAAAIAPNLAPVPEQAAQAEELPVPQPTATRRPAPTPTATRRPAPTPTATRRPSPAPSASRRPTPAPSATATRSGGSRIGSDFLEGMSDADGDRGQAGDRPSAQQQASIGAAIIRQLKPHWNPPSGVEVDRLVTVVRFRLNRDGTLNGSPEVLRQTGLTDANRPQASRHAEQAIRAVRLAAPFNLPERFYSGWSVVTSTFDNRLAQ